MRLSTAIHGTRSPGAPFQLPATAPPRSPSVSARRSRLLSCDLNTTLGTLPPPATHGQGFPISILKLRRGLRLHNCDKRCWIVSTGWPEQDTTYRGRRAPRELPFLHRLAQAAQAFRVQGTKCRATLRIIDLRARRLIFDVGARTPAPANDSEAVKSMTQPTLMESWASGARD